MSKKKDDYKPNLESEKALIVSSLMRNIKPAPGFKVRAIRGNRSKGAK